MPSKTMLKSVHIGLSTGHSGSLGPEHPGFIRSFEQLDGVQVVAYCEWNDMSYHDRARQHNSSVNVYLSVDDLIAKEEFDVACVTLPPSEVPDTCFKLAEAGKHFLTDKQVARKSQDLHKVVKSVRRNKLTTFVNYPRRFHPAAQDLRTLIDEGVLGKPVHVESRQFSSQVGGPYGNDPQRTAYRDDTEGGGVLHYIGCHDLDLMRFIMGCEIKSVQAMTARAFGYTEETVEDIAILALEYENGAFASLQDGYTKPAGAGPGGYDAAFVFRGTEGWAAFHGMDGWDDRSRFGSPKLEIYTASPKWKGSPQKTIDYTLAPFEGIRGTQWYHNRIQGFIDDIRAGREGEVNINDALYVLQSIDAAYESARTGRRVEVKYGV